MVIKKNLKKILLFEEVRFCRKAKIYFTDFRHCVLYIESQWLGVKTSIINKIDWLYIYIFTSYDLIIAFFKSRPEI